MRSMRRFRLALFGMAVIWAVAGTAYAMTSLIFDDFVSTCTGLNCSSLTVPGTVLGDGGPGYFEVGLFASAGQCLRADVISQGTDLEMVVRPPTGTAVFRNDDRSIFDFRPLVKFVAPVTGWYSTTLARFDGSSVDASFTMLYGRYSPGSNPNCSSPTPPLIPAELEPEKPADGGAPEPAG